MAPLPRHDLLLASLATLLVVSSSAAAIFYRRERRAERRGAEERRLAAMGAATARILHQVKNPLQTIILHADLLREAAVAGDATARVEVSGAISAEAQRLAAMLEELSAYAAGATRALERRPVPLHGLVRDLAAREAREGRVTVVASRIEECTVAADPYYLSQALENLIVNAREAMGREAAGRLTLEVERRGGEAVVRVIDEGPGIAPDAVEAIFQPFVTRKGKGMGLGLPIAREIVEEHGGRIELRTEPGKGSEFRVVLPLDARGGGR